MASFADVEAKFAELFPSSGSAIWADDEEDLFDEDGFLIDDDGEGIALAGEGDALEYDDDDDEDWLGAAEDCSGGWTSSPPPYPVDDRLSERGIYLPAGFDYRHDYGCGGSALAGLGRGWEPLPTIYEQDEEDEEEDEDSSSSDGDTIAETIPPPQPPKPLIAHFLGRLPLAIVALGLSNQWPMPMPTSSRPLGLGWGNG